MNPEFRFRYLGKYFSSQFLTEWTDLLSGERNILLKFNFQAFKPKNRTQSHCQIMRDNNFGFYFGDIIIMNEIPNHWKTRKCLS